MNYVTHFSQLLTFDLSFSLCHLDVTYFQAPFPLLSEKLRHFKRASPFRVGMSRSKPLLRFSLKEGYR